MTDTAASPNVTGKPISTELAIAGKVDIKAALIDNTIESQTEYYIRRELKPSMHTKPNAHTTTSTTSHSSDLRLLNHCHVCDGASVAWCQTLSKNEPMADCSNVTRTTQI